MGLIVCDAGVLIALLDSSDAHHNAARDALAVHIERGDRFVLPVSAYAEILVGPLRRDESAARVVEDLVDQLPMVVQPVDRVLARVAAELRARYERLRLPDALVIATAMTIGASELLTTDQGWPELPVAVTAI